MQRWLLNCQPKRYKASLIILMTRESLANLDLWHEYQLSFVFETIKMMKTSLEFIVHWLWHLASASVSALTSTSAETIAIKTNICTMNLLMAYVLYDMKFVTPLKNIAQFARFDMLAKWICAVVLVHIASYTLLNSVPIAIRVSAIKFKFMLIWNCIHGLLRSHSCVSI